MNANCGLIACQATKAAQMDYNPVTIQAVKTYTVTNESHPPATGGAPALQKKGVPPSRGALCVIALSELCEILTDDHHTTAWLVAPPVTISSLNTAMLLVLPDRLSPSEKFYSPRKSCPMRASSLSRGRCR